MPVLVLLPSDPFLTLDYLALGLFLQTPPLSAGFCLGVATGGTGKRTGGRCKGEARVFLLLSLCLSTMNISLPAAPLTLQDSKHSPKTLYLGNNTVKNQTLLWLFPKALFFAT